MASFLVKSVRTGDVVATVTIENNADTLAKSLNKFAREEAGTLGLPTSAEDVVYVDRSAVPSNPAYSKTRDPQREMLSALLLKAVGGSAMPGEVSVVPDDVSALTGGEPDAEAAAPVAVQG